ncbi:MAG: hypothetical protein LKG79_04610 [Furfurilactobacillus sp.]|jgi:hypothetical protein|uniref:Addiction module toxin RelE n=1 Tax=Furfurilactobacillus milii TaxID=2888272 RepID=A0ABT6DBD4_9LACO|nr:MULTISPECIES: hypothetical protein [Furfurilactobacillus]QLE67696.1 hypothetical protein LROSL2_2379 [Furfurilactobacillus rossiae]MCF6160452.1 hypothetical protein [Furfurilactobacillus milii]MCF6162684.1 hypothetical protein [Furfurilactobacillus milii]MCF6418307.1 hypothetical protein [Furfurilactobacillus milii]MCH4011825.1 hypothetical protein [Furfurilactobacillus sp.]
MQAVFDKSGCRSFFKKFRSQQHQIQNEIIDAIDEQINLGMSKTKIAAHERINGRSIHEFRLNLGTIGSAQVVFYVNNQLATVLFISTDLQKRTFTDELDRFLKERG